MTISVNHKCKSLLSALVVSSVFVLRMIGVFRR